MNHVWTHLDEWLKAGDRSYSLDGYQPTEQGDVDVYHRCELEEQGKVVGIGSAETAKEAVRLALEDLGKPK